MGVACGGAGASPIAGEFPVYSAPMYTLAELKPGRTVVVDGDPYLITWSKFSKQGRQGGVMATKIKNLKTGALIQRTFQGSDKIEPADVGYRKAQFLYHDGSGFAFMDLNSYEQFSLDSESIGDLKKYLSEGAEVDAMIFEGKPIGVKLPPTVNLEVAETSPGVKGDTATGGTKPATLSSGLTVQVPLFIHEGDTVKVNTETGVYMERVNA
jgi:elongation factor P